MAQRRLQLKPLGGIREPKSTLLVREKLKREGIPCLAGKLAGFTFIDLAAWGCIPIEAKGATFRAKNLFGDLSISWGYSYQQKERWFPVDTIFVFVAIYKDSQEKRYFIVPSTENFLRIGRLKNGRIISQSKNALTASENGGYVWEQLLRFEDNYQLIEQARIALSEKLKKT